MLCRKKNEPINRYSRAPYGLLTTDYRSLYSFSKTICTWDARAHRHSELQIEQNWDRKKEGRKRSFKLHLLLLLHPLLHFLKKIAMANSLFQSMDGRRIQAAINCSFFLSQNQIEQKKLLPETVVFFVFLIYFSQRIIFRPSSKL
jgi:hypothetical protein